MPTKVVRTYSARQTGARPALHQKRPLEDTSNLDPSPKRAKVAKANKTSDRRVGGAKKHKQKTLTQLHFCTDKSIFRTCPFCNMSFTCGAPDDESLHRAHCARVQRGMEWGKEEEREAMKSGVVEFSSSVKLKNGSRGRIIYFRADIGGRIGSKLRTLLDTINLSLAAPHLTASVLQASKAYLFLLNPVDAKPGREKIVGCVIAQRIETAMAIATPEDCDTERQDNLKSSSSLIAVDSAKGIFCYPAALRTPLGIPRLFVSSAYRRQGIATLLLSAAAETFVYGCPLDPTKGQVAFTQPTGDGSAVMLRWGRGGVRIYEE